MAGENSQWLLKNSFGVLALKTRRARMPYKRRSLPRYTFLVTQLGAVLPHQGLFQQPQPDFVNQISPLSERGLLAPAEELDYAF